MLAANQASAHEARARRELPAPRAHLARDPNLTIVDFQFTPHTITIHVDNTITWTNNGPSSHTATARDGSFNTGVLSKGASASHTFSRAGTFAYYCAIHPSMLGTIVVLAAATSTTNNRSSKSAASTSRTGSASTTSNQPATTTRPATTTHPATTTRPATTTEAAATTQTASKLPFTGLDLTTGLLSGIVLIALGLAIRRTAQR